MLLAREVLTCDRCSCRADTASVLPAWDFSSHVSAGSCCPMFLAWWPVVGNVGLVCMGSSWWFCPFHDVCRSQSCMCRGVPRLCAFAYSCSCALVRLWPCPRATHRGLLVCNVAAFKGFRRVNQVSYRKGLFGTSLVSFFPLHMTIRLIAPSYCVAMYVRALLV